MTTPIKFHISDDRHTFHPFRRLPREIRHKIWEICLSTPGVHFVKLVAIDKSWRWTWDRRRLFTTIHETSDGNSSGDEVDAALREDTKPFKTFKTCLMPVGPCATADLSHYNALNKQMRMFSRASAEAHAVVSLLCRRTDTIRLGDNRILSLGQSPDVIYLEYFTAEQFSQARHLVTLPLCPGLEHIQRLAVRFSRGWVVGKEACNCRLCRATAARRHRPCLPAHLFEFLARHVPRLREFFFIDYLIVRKSGSTSAGSDESTETRNFPRFRAGNRLYYEAYEDEWTMNTEITEILQWLKKSFVRYAKESKLSTHRRSENVRFSVLACEWDIVPPVQRIISKKTNKRRSIISAVSRQRRATAWRLSMMATRNAHAPPLCLPDDSSTYDFTFTCRAEGGPKFSHT